MSGEAPSEKAGYQVAPQQQSIAPNPLSGYGQLDSGQGQGFQPIACQFQGAGSASFGQVDKETLAAWGQLVPPSQGSGGKKSSGVPALGEIRTFDRDGRLISDDDPEGPPAAKNPANR